MLTLCLIESPDQPSPESTIGSFGDIVTGTMEIPNWDFHLIECPTEYFMVMYTAETIDDALREAIPVFLQYKQFDFFVFYKKLVSHETHLFTAPRLFKQAIKLCQDSIRPKNPEGLSCEKILNGWIIECR